MFARVSVLHPMKIRLLLALTQKAAAIACHLANGATITDSVRKACRYVDAGIRTSVDLGKGSGPLNHFHSVQSLPFAPYACPVS